MKRTNNKYCLELVTEKTYEFQNEYNAIVAANTMAMYFTTKGNLTTCYYSRENGRYEVDVHFDFNTYPTNPEGFLFSSYRLSSHEYYRDGKVERVRVKSYLFKAR